MRIEALLKSCVLLPIFSLISCASAVPKSTEETPVIKIEKDLPSTFSVEQEKVLAQNHKVLAFLYHMTRKKLNFKQMGELYALKSVSTYRAFMIKHGLIKGGSGDDVEFLFLNPYGTWALRNKNPQERPILAETTKLGLERLTNSITGIAINEDDTVTPIWTTNTYRLTPDEYRMYKAELINLTKKYSKISQAHLNGNTPHQVIWSMTIARTTTAFEAEKSHMLFGEVEEF